MVPHDVNKERASDEEKDKMTETTSDHDNLVENVSINKNTIIIIKNL